MDNKRSNVVWIFVLLLLLAPLATYVGVYFALVTPGHFAPVEGKTYYVPYRMGGRNAERFFSPLERVDRAIRPRAWELDARNWEAMSEELMTSPDAEQP
jgi:hypothetical protein